MEVKNINWPELVFSGPSLGMIFWMSLGFAELLRKKDLSLSPTQLEICSKVNRSFSNWRRKHLYGSGEKILPFDIIVRMYVFEETLALL